MTRPGEQRDGSYGSIEERWRDQVRKTERDVYGAESVPSAGSPQAAAARPLDAEAILAAAERFTWAVAPLSERHWPLSTSREFLDVALRAVKDDEREGYVARLEAFVERHRARLEELLRAYGPGSKPASHGRNALVGQPESLVICERMESNPFLNRSQ
ncbi:hypothetical protein ACFVY0_44225 [Streptomyces sp. NPDC058286]|uniref:hypothetical protein n=1 Tax=Streptomyces sp. NPDC058286 TaxID=3346422 RepID=UPI0036F16015